MSEKIMLSAENTALSIEVIELFDKVDVGNKAKKNIEMLAYELLKLHNEVFPDSMLQLNYSFGSPVKLRSDNSRFFVQICAQDVNDESIEYVICSTRELIDPYSYQERIEKDKDFHKREDARLALYRTLKAELGL